MRGHVGYTAQPARRHVDCFTAVRAGPLKANVSLAKVSVPRCVENLAHPLAAYADFPGDASHVGVLAALGGSNNALGG